MNSVADIWKIVLSRLSQDLSETTISTWFDEVEAVSIKDRTLYLHCPNDFKRSTIESMFSDRIKDSLRDIYSADFDVKLLSTAESTALFEPEVKKSTALLDSGEFTFDTFVVGESNKMAYAAARAVADGVGVPVILYNVPSRTGVNIESATARELAKNPLICGIKEASGNISQIAMTAALCGDELPLYSGNDDQVVPILALGGKGVISVVSNVAPEPMHRMCQLWFDGKIEESRDLQLKLMGLCKAMFCEVNPIPVKAALEMMGLPSGPCRLPLVPLSDDHAALVRRELQNAGLS